MEAHAPINRPTLAERAAEATRDLSLSCTVSYNGAPFCGFAKQPGMPTVQGELETALTTLMRRPVDIVCSGRTDAGVHARGQVVSFEVDEAEIANRTEASLVRSLNALTCDDIVVREVRRRPRGFSARFDALWREYRYFIGVGDTPPLFMRDFSWFRGPALDVDAMRAGAAHLIGEHDFKSFCMAASAEGKSTTRCVDRIDFAHEEVMGEPMLVMTIVGNAFLHSMVRTIVGTLMLVGKGKRDPDWVYDVLKAKNRSMAGENAPASGLVFWKVGYEDE